MNALIVNGSGNFICGLHYSSNANRNVKKSSFNLKFLKELLFT